jgi:putative ABC transport system ATP-binding protein
VEVVLRVLRSLASPGRVVLVSTHDERIVPLADRVIELTPELKQERKTKKQTLAAGEVLFEERSRGALIYVVDEGEIEVFKLRSDGSEEVLATYGAKEYFGELGPLLGFARAATARASRASVVTGYTVPEFRKIVGATKMASLLGKASRPDGRARAPKKKPAARKAVATKRRSRT